MKDWTTHKGRANSSPKFKKLVGEVARLIKSNGGHCLDEGWVEGTAQLVMAQLAHVHGVKP